jgi:hypothetical protein
LYVQLVKTWIFLTLSPLPNSAIGHFNARLDTMLRPWSPPLPTCYHPHYSHLAISWLPNSITAIWSKVANAVPVNIYLTRSNPHSGVYNINFMILNFSWKFPEMERKISQICSRKKENSKKSQFFAQKKNFGKKIIVLNTSYEARIL